MFTCKDTNLCVRLILNKISDIGNFCPYLDMDNIVEYCWSLNVKPINLLHGIVDGEKDVIVWYVQLQMKCYKIA